VRRGPTADLDLHRHPHLDFLSRAWRLRDNISAYDAMYVALAEAIEAPIVTCDGPLAKAPGHRARIEVAFETVRPPDDRRRARPGASRLVVHLGLREDERRATITL
jgi:hypothetical protein